MSTDRQDVRHLLLIPEARTLAKHAREAASVSEAGSAAWHFYHGVETAAAHVLHPEMAGVREGTAWLDAEEPAFRDGFLEGSSALAAAATAQHAPGRVPLPRPPAP